MYMPPPATGKRSFRSKASIWVSATRGLSGPLGGHVQYVLLSTRSLCSVCVCCFFLFCFVVGSGTRCAPNRTERCREPQKRFSVHLFFKKNPRWFCQPTCQSGRPAGGCQCGSGMLLSRAKVTFPAGGGETGCGYGAATGSHSRRKPHVRLFFSFSFASLLFMYNRFGFQVMVSVCSAAGGL